jgi:ubiquinone/menaquinone biosynthesis C-methylase UbiE
MAMLNRLPGGVGASVAAVRRLLDGEGSRPVLDIGAGYGDFARRLRRTSPIPIVVADRSHDVLAVTRGNVARVDHVTVLVADVRALPMADEAISVAHASLLLHHLSPSDAVLAFREMRRVARHGIVINDLRRSRLALALTAAPILAFAHARYTRHDGILSARRAYTVDELDDFAADAGLRPVARSARWWPRVTTTYR